MKNSIDVVGSIKTLEATYPNAATELKHWKTPFQFLIAVILSAQTTDIAVNKCTPALFAKFKTPWEFSKVSPKDVEVMIKSIGLANIKAENICKTAKIIAHDYAGTVPSTMKELVELPGVGRKTANVVLSNVLGVVEGIVVDTHVLRLSKRFGWTTKNKPHQVEKDLMKFVNKNKWKEISHLLTWHGRRRCFAINPDCEKCELGTTCPKIGVSSSNRKSPPREYLDPEI